MKEEISEVNGIGITKNLIGINYTRGIFIKPKYIVIHDISDKRFTTMREYRNYIAREKEAKESMHYLVGARNVIKLLEDDWRGWHVGDKPSKYVTNSNSISIAMFIRDSRDINRTLKNVVTLVNKLRSIYEISVDNVKRHYDVTGKRCPEILIPEGAWNRFKLALKGVEDELKPIAKGKVIDVLSSLNLRKEPNDESQVIGRISSKDSFYIYENKGEWVKTSYETDEKVVIGYLNKEYIEIEELEKLSNPEKRIIDNSKEKTIKVKDINRDGEVINIETNLAVRRGAGDENFVIGYLLAAQKVMVVQESGSWYKIVYQSTIGKRIGFVEKDFIKLE